MAAARRWPGTNIATSQHIRFLRLRCEFAAASVGGSTSQRDLETPRHGEANRVASDLFKNPNLRIIFRYAVGGWAQPNSYRQTTFTLQANNAKRTGLHT
jgi:hypothetical protein